MAVHQCGVPPKTALRGSAFQKSEGTLHVASEARDNNANFAWVQHFIHHLAPQRMAGFDFVHLRFPPVVLANGSMSSNPSGDCPARSASSKPKAKPQSLPRQREIRRALIQADLVDCMVARPGQLFYSTQIPVCLWFLAKNKAAADRAAIAADEGADEQTEYGRSPAFRRLILDIYDHQCAACGLRIRLPATNDVSFIDAAHLIPFVQSHNDHPTNGLALCKNHHWAMDRHILAPGPDLLWHVSPLIDPRRSNGEQELHNLAGRSLLLPKDPAFQPDEEGLRWRCGKLSA